MTVFFIILAVLLFVNILLFRFNTGSSAQVNLEPEFKVEKNTYPEPHLV